MGTFEQNLEQCARYANVIGAASLEELANDLRARWARNWVDDGGPTGWISRLRRMGAKGYPADLAGRLELFWGIRHVVVHAAGVATADFVRRHPGVAAARGGRLRVGSKDIEAFLSAISDFTGPIEAFFLARYPAIEKMKPLASN